MAIRSFRVENVRGLALAHHSELPDLVVIAGGNGTGKSTLLDQLFRRRAEVSEPGTKVLYLGPSRTQRRGQVSAGAILAMQGDLISGLSIEHGPTFTNFTPHEFAATSGQPRGLEGVDDSYSLMKYEIQRLENLRREALAQLHERDGEVARGALPDVYAPIRELTRYLLPHLAFSRVDQTNQNHLRCLFERTDGSSKVEVELDDLSSGEKAVIALFMPLIALQIRRALQGIGVQLASVEEVGSVTAIIDEPEIHLHPALQGHLAHYLREVSARDGAQFILATHSPTLIDAAGDDELFALMPSEFVGGGNQFRKLVSDHDRLEAVRDLVGSATLITRARPILFVEGESSRTKSDSDSRLLTILVPESASWVVVPARGRSEAIRSANQLHSELAHEMPALQVFALVDSDSLPPDDERMIAWPVAMIENLLLDAEAISALINPVGLPKEDATPAGVQRLLLEVAKDFTEDEIRIRVQRDIGRLNATARFDEHAISTDELSEQYQAYVSHIREAGDEVIARARADVATILAEGVHLERFRGKQILDAFFSRAGLAGHFSKSSFRLLLAREATAHPRLRTLVRQPSGHIQFFTPRELLDLVNELDPTLPQRERALQAVKHARAAMAGDVTPADMDSTRDVLRQLAEALRQLGEEEQAASARILELIPLLGLGRQPN